MRVLFTLLLCFALGPKLWSQTNEVCPPSAPVPFSTTESHLTIWDGDQYVPFFVKGMNLGVALPGTSPSELAATTEDYYRWFTDIKEAGFNCIRVYTLHYPRFYAALDSFNTANPSEPLFLMLGIWLEEELAGYNQDLYFLEDTFQHNAEIAVDVIHGDAQIPPRLGKAFGTYTTDVSKWVMAYVLGREVYPNEILNTNRNHPNDRSYSGQYLSVADAEPATRWVAKQMDYVLQYEMDTYGNSRPISFSSWPTLDPIDHPYIFGVSYPEEDTAQIDLAQIDHSKAPGGLFATFHAYPYYPPFVSAEEKYRQESDEYGPNSYIGYLKELRDEHPGMPVVIGEFGTPTSWGNASYAHSGMHHGGMSPDQAGQYGLRMFKNMLRNNLAGGCYFSWIDEWFKRTWITDEYDFPLDARLRWHNIMAPEQNFGLLGYKQTGLQFEPFDFYGITAPVSDVAMQSSYDFLSVKAYLNQPIGNNDTLWLALDTYDANLGESVLPTGQATSNRAEFVLSITQNNATMYVTQAYDAYGIYFGVDNKAIYEEGQRYRSIASDGAPWKLMRWRNEELNSNAIQVVGDLKVNQPGEILNVVTLTEDSVLLEIPWNLINFTDPSLRTVLHDDIDTRGVRETRTSDGIALTWIFNGETLGSSKRYVWDTWTRVSGDYAEVKKSSYYILRDSLRNIDNPVIGQCDAYELAKNSSKTVARSAGVLANDFTLDNHTLQASLVQAPTFGQVALGFDGSFTYTPNPDFEGIDNFSYALNTDGTAPSTPINVLLSVGLENADSALVSKKLRVYPNPSGDLITLEAEGIISRYELIDTQGRLVFDGEANNPVVTLDVSAVREGLYLVTAYSGQAIITRRIQIAR